MVLADREAIRRQLAGSRGQRALALLLSLSFGQDGSRPFPPHPQISSRWRSAGSPLRPTSEARTSLLGAPNSGLGASLCAWQAPGDRDRRPAVLLCLARRLGHRLGHDFASFACLVAFLR